MSGTIFVSFLMAFCFFQNMNFFSNDFINLVKVFGRDQFLLLTSCLLACILPYYQYIGCLLVHINVLF